MHIGRSVSLRGLFAAILALAVLAGGACVLLVGSRNEAEATRAAEAAALRTARLISDRLGEELAAVGRDVRLAAENTVLGPQGNGAAVRQFLERWRALHPGYADILVADRNGRVLVAASGSLAGADVSGTTWFSRGLSGIVIGDASDRTRAGADIPLNVIVGAPVRAGGVTEIGVLAVQLAPDWIQETVAALRRSLGGAARDAAVQVMNAGGRTLHRSTGVAREGRVHEATAAIAEGVGLGWLVSVKERAMTEDGAGTGSATVLALAAAALAAAYAGGVLGGWLGRDFGRIVGAAREDRGERLHGVASTADLARLAEAVGACIGRSKGRERLLREARAALARSRERVRAGRLLGGFTCWEVDLRNGQVTWADGSAASADRTSERACDLEQVLARVEARDRDLLTRAMRAVCEEPGAIHEAVIQTLAGPEDAAGRRLVLRLTAVALDGQPVRLHVLTRELALVALPAPANAAAPSRSNAVAAPEHPAALPLLAVVSGIAEDIGGAFEAVAAALEGADRPVGPARDRRIDVALGEAARGHALLRRLATIVRPEGAREEVTDAATVLRETAAFIRAAILPGLTLVLPQGDLPRVACGARHLEVALLNLASDVRASVPPDAAVCLTVAHARPSADGGATGLRVELSAPHGFQADRGLAAIHDAMDAIGGRVGVAPTGGGVVVTLVFPAAPPRSATAARSVLLVESDAVLRAATAESLAGHGYAVTSAASVEQAGRALAEHRDYAVLLCAHAMPAVDGLRLAEVVSRTHPAMAIVLMADEAIRPRGQTVVRTLRKPFGSQDLVDALDAATSAVSLTAAA